MQVEVEKVDSERRWVFGMGSQCKNSILGRRTYCTLPRYGAMIAWYTDLLILWSYDCVVDELIVPYVALIALYADLLHPMEL
jgi:hypothetical protein